MFSYVTFSISVPTLRNQIPTDGINVLIVSFVYFLFIIGHVGPPLPCNKIKLVDVPEMEYYAKDGKGEVRKSLNHT